MLLELVLGFESHVGRTVQSVCKNNKKRNQLLKARSSVGRCDSMRVNEGRRGRSILEIKFPDTCRGGERGEEPAS